MAKPSARVEIFFDTTGEYFGRFWTIGESEIGGPDPIAGDSWFDLSSRAYSGLIERGKDQEVDEVRPGRAEIVLDNRDQAFDPDYVASPFYGQIQPGRKVRVIATVEGVDQTLFSGTVDDWRLNDDPGVLPNVTLVAFDALADLAAAELDEIAAGHSGDTSGERVERVLDLAEVAFPADQRDIDAGQSVFGDTTLSEAGNAASYLNLCALSEGGALFCTVDDVLRFAQRDDGPGAVQAVFSNDGGADAILYESAPRPYSREQLYTRIVTAGTTGADQVVIDEVAAQNDTYKIRTLQRRGQLVLSDDEMLAQAQWLLSRFSTPERRFREVETNVATQSVARQTDLLGLELRSRVQIEKTPPAGDQIVQDGLVEGLTWRWSQNVMTSTVTVAAGARLFGWIIGDDVYGVIGNLRINY